MYVHFATLVQVTPGADFVFLLLARHSPSELGLYPLLRLSVQK